MEKQTQTSQVDASHSEQNLIWGLLLSMRIEGFQEVEISNGLFHKAFAHLLDEHEEQVLQLLGFVPVANPLFGEFESVNEALDEAHRAGIVGFRNPTYRRMTLDLSRESAQRLLGRIGQNGATYQKLAHSFAQHYSKLTNK